MRPPAPNALLARAAKWEDLTRWERAEVGRALRRLGWAYTEIRQVIPVPKSTLSGWCQTVALTWEQVEAIRDRSVSAAGVPRDTQWRRREEIAAIREAAAAEVADLIHEPLWVAGITLYWGEGSKTSSRLALTNTDPLTLVLFRRWTRQYLDDAAEFVLALHLHDGNDEGAAKHFWTHVLDLPEAPFHKTFIKPPGTGHRKNHLPNGVCRVTVRRSANHLVRTMAWIKELPAALDLLQGGAASLAAGR